MTNADSNASEGKSTVKPAKSITQKILWFVAFAVAFVAVKEIKQWYFDRQAFEKAGSAANQSMDEMRARAAAEHPEKPVAYAVQEEAVKRSNESLSQKSGDKKADAAAGQFIGYYMINVRTRYDYCNSLGVDISPYTNAFIAEHKDLYAKSRMIHARSPYTPDKIESAMYEQLLPTFQKTIVDAMSTIAKQNNATEKDVCVAFNTNGAELAAEMLLAKINPALNQAMLEAK